MRKVHYATGGSITAEKSEFNTLCGRKFRQGHSEIMRSGWGWKEYLTCKQCKGKLEAQETKEQKAKEIMANAKKEVARLYA